MAQLLNEVPDLREIEESLRVMIVDAGGYNDDEPTPDKRLIEDLGFDSIGWLDLSFRVEKQYGVRLPHPEDSDSLLKTVFSRGPMRIGDLAEIIYLLLTNQDLNTAELSRRSNTATVFPTPCFTQISGVPWRQSTDVRHAFDDLGDGRYRRHIDGMICIDIPAQKATIGSREACAEADERPAHEVHVDEFRIDSELVSTTAYCRFLNAVQPNEDLLATWLLVPGQNPNARFTPIEVRDGYWSALAPAAAWPMFNVSWFGAAAYSLWANGYPVELTESEHSFLPSELQWEVAARGGYQHLDADGNPTLVAGLHKPETTYETSEFPFGSVHENRGLSDYGLKHAAGNVWEWCRDWYAEDFYTRSEATEPNRENQCPTGVRAERGGSWVGPVELCRTTYRRGRIPTAFGRCLGFRCISTPNSPN